MLFNINSSFKYIHLFYSKLGFFYLKTNKKQIFNNIFKNKINFFFFVKKASIKKYYYFFKYFLKISDYAFIKCSNLFFYRSLHTYINTLYNISSLGINFFFLSKNSNFNFLWNFDVNFFSKNFNKSSFLRFLVNFFKKNNIKMLIFLDKTFFNLLPFFKKFSFLISGLISFNIHTNFLDVPLYLDNLSLYNKYFFYNLTYKVYILSLSNKYFYYIQSYLKIKQRSIRYEVW